MTPLAKTSQTISAVGVPTALINKAQPTGGVATESNPHRCTSLPEPERQFGDDGRHRLHSVATHHVRRRHRGSGNKRSTPNRTILGEFHKSEGTELAATVTTPSTQASLDSISQNSPVVAGDVRKGDHRGFDEDAGDANVPKDAIAVSRRCARALEFLHCAIFRGRRDARRLIKEQPLETTRGTSSRTTAQPIIVGEVRKKITKLRADKDRIKRARPSRSSRSTGA